jgi:RNA polymerase sigma factor (sigma-70 family)
VKLRPFASMSTTLGLSALPLHTTANHFEFSDKTPEDLVALSRAGNDLALEELFNRFRPLLRARMQRLWTAIRQDLTPVEWADVEAQVNYAFFYRIERFEPRQGVFFAHYIERMISFDCTAWLREQRRATAVPFSQLGAESADVESWIESELGLTHEIDSVLSLRSALDDLSPAQRDAVWQVCVLGLTEDDAARRLQISRSSLRNRLEAGLTSIRKCFDNNFVADARTRTGRQSAKLAVLDAWQERLYMAKDEKRPDLVGVGAGRPVLLQGIFPFEATGLESPQLLSPKLRYIVPAGHVAGIRFVRVGAICDAMVCLSTVVNGLTHRLVPVAANQSVHIPFAIVEPLVAGSEIEIHIASNAPGTVIIDVGCLQMPA